MGRRPSLLRTGMNVEDYLILSGLVLSLVGAVLIAVLRARAPLIAVIAGVVLFNTALAFRWLNIQRSHGPQRYLLLHAAAILAGLGFAVSLVGVLVTGRQALGATIPGGLTAGTAALSALLGLGCYLLPWPWSIVHEAGDAPTKAK